MSRWLQPTRYDILRGLKPTLQRFTSSERLCVFHLRQSHGVSRRKRCLPATARHCGFAFAFARRLIRADEIDFRANQTERE